jgi:hypothetical protein
MDIERRTFSNRVFYVRGKYPGVQADFNAFSHLPTGSTLHTTWAFLPLRQIDLDG